MFVKLIRLDRKWMPGFPYSAGPAVTDALVGEFFFVTGVRYVGPDGAGWGDRDGYYLFTGLLDGDAYELWAWELETGADGGPRLFLEPPAEYVPLGMRE